MGDIRRYWTDAAGSAFSERIAAHAAEQLAEQRAQALASGVKESEPKISAADEPSEEPPALPADIAKKVWVCYDCVETVQMADLEAHFSNGECEAARCVDCSRRIKGYSNCLAHCSRCRPGEFVSIRVKRKFKPQNEETQLEREIKKEEAAHKLKMFEIKMMAVREASAKSCAQDRSRRKRSETFLHGDVSA